MNYYGTYQQPYMGYNSAPYMNNMYNNLPQSTIQQLNQQPPQIQQQPTVEQNLQYVDSVDVVKSTNARLDGQAMYFPKTDGSEIYCKKLNTKTGAGMILTYKLVSDDEQPQSFADVEQITSMIGQVKDDINELKELFLDKVTTPHKGGGRL